jgi:WD40 repeat protein
MSDLLTEEQARSLAPGGAQQDKLMFDAFVSYRHVEQDRRWARWIQRQLETYRIPAGVAAKQGRGRRMRPVFRDEDELPAASHLPDELKENLRRSEFLIVVCSPRTPESEWINQEIQYFAELGRADHILTLLVEGEPAEAFPPALRQIRLPGHEDPGAEPLAADVRPSAGESRRERQRIAMLKLAARIVGCRFDELRRRDQMRRMRRLTALAIGLTALVAVLTLGIVTVIDTANVALREGTRATESASENRRRLVTGLLESGLQAQEGGDFDEALVYFAEAISSAEAVIQEPRRTWVDRWLARWRPRAVAASDTTQQRLLRLRFATILRSFPPLVGVLPPDVGRLAVALSPDGRCLLTGSDSAALASWNVNTGGPCVHLDLRTIPTSVQYIQFDTAGERFLTQDTLGKLRVWNARTGQLVSAQLPDVRESVRLSPDGTSVLTAANNADVAEAIEVETGEVRRAYGLTGDTTSVTIAAYSRDGRLVATAGWSGQNTIGELWDASTGRPIGRPMRHQDFLRDQTQGAIDFATVSSMEFDWTGTRLVTSSWGGSAQVWDARTGVPVTPPMRHTLRQGGRDVDHYVLHAAFDPSGRYLVSTGDDGTARIWDARTGTHVCSTPREDEGKPVFHAEFSPDGARFATASESGIARVWSASGCEPLTPPLRHAGPARTARFSRDGHRLVTAGSGSAVRVWDVTPEDGVRRPVGRHAVTAKFTLAGPRVIVYGPRLLEVWDPTTRTRVRVDLERDIDVREAVVSTDGNRLATLDATGRARVWDVRTGRRIGPGFGVILPEADRGEMVLRISADGTRVMTGAGRTLSLWNSVTGEQVVRLSNAAGVEFASNGAHLFARMGDSLVVLDAGSGQRLPLTEPRSSASVVLNSLAYAPRFGWSAEYMVGGVLVQDRISGDTVTTFVVPVNGGAFHQADLLAFNPDGERLLTGTTSGVIRLWDSRTGTALTPPFGLGAQVRTHEFSPDGQLLLTVAADGRPRILDVRGWLPVAPPLTRGYPVQHAAFDRSGRSVLTLSVSEPMWTARVWDLSPENRPAGDLRALAQFLGGLRINGSGALAPLHLDSARLERSQLEACVRDSKARCGRQGLRSQSLPRR